MSMSSPLDFDIAVDPGMLGRIFEEVVTGGHDSGSYYTPKPIVSFMCREALKGYLERRLPVRRKRLWRGSSISMSRMKFITLRLC